MQFESLCCWQWGKSSRSQANFCKLQGDHLSGKPGNVREFGTYQGNVREKILSWKSVPKLFITRWMLAFPSKTVHSLIIYVKTSTTGMLWVPLNMGMSATHCQGISECLESGHPEISSGLHISGLSKWCRQEVKNSNSRTVGRLDECAEGVTKHVRPGNTAPMWPNRPGWLTFLCCSSIVAEYCNTWDGRDDIVILVPISGITQHSRESWQWHMEPSIGHWSVI